MRAMLDAFHVAATRIRNSLLPGVTLSPSLPTFKHQIKTVLFAHDNFISSWLASFCRYVQCPCSLLTLRHHDS